MIRDIWETIVFVAFVVAIFVVFGMLGDDPNAFVVFH